MKTSEQQSVMSRVVQSRWFWPAATSSVAFLIFTIFLSLVSAGEIPWFSRVVAALLASALVGSWVALRPTIGGSAALASTALASAALFAALSALPTGMCGDVVNLELASRPCTGSEVLQWSAGGALAVVSIALFTAPLWVGAAAWRAWRRRANGTGVLSRILPPPKADSGKETLNSGGKARRSVGTNRHGSKTRKSEDTR